MAVKTSPFTGWKLSGKDADAFLKQVNESVPNQRARDALERGRALSKRIAEKDCSVKPQTVSLLKKVCINIKKLLAK